MTKGVIPEDVLREIRVRASDCADVAQWLSLRGGRGRRRWFCPACQNDRSRTPDLSTPRSGGFRCFKCDESGDALALVALAHRRPLTGSGFVEVACWLAERVGLGDAARPGGESLRPFPPRPLVHAPPPEQIAMPDAVVAAAWSALELRQGDESPAAQWLQTRGIPPALVRSGFGTLDAVAVADLADAPAAPWLRRHVDSAIVAPFRSARTGGVFALQCRALSPRGDDEKRRTVGTLSDDDGTPRAYGRPDLARTAAVIVLVEGMADTFAAEAITTGLDVVVVGANNANALCDVAEWLAGHPCRVVVVPHLDGKKLSPDGKGQEQARSAAALVGGRVFRWGAFALRLPAVRERMACPEGLDLAEAVKLSGIDAARSAFFAAAGIDAPLPKLEAPKESAPRRASIERPRQTTPVASRAWESSRPVANTVPRAEDDRENLTATVDETVAEIWGAP